MFNMLLLLSLTRTVIKVLFIRQSPVKWQYETEQSQRAFHPNNSDSIDVLKQKRVRCNAEKFTSARIAAYQWQTNPACFLSYENLAEKSIGRSSWYANCLITDRPSPFSNRRWEATTDTLKLAICCSKWIKKRDPKNELFLKAGEGLQYKLVHLLGRGKEKVKNLWRISYELSDLFGGVWEIIDRKIEKNFHMK